MKDIYIIMENGVIQDVLTSGRMRVIVSDYDKHGEPQNLVNTFLSSNRTIRDIKVMIAEDIAAEKEQVDKLGDF